MEPWDRTSNFAPKAVQVQVKFSTRTSLALENSTKLAHRVKGILRRNAERGKRPARPTSNQSMIKSDCLRWKRE